MNNDYSFNECILKPILGLFIYDRNVATQYVGLSGFWWYYFYASCCLILRCTSLNVVDL